MIDLAKRFAHNPILLPDEVKPSIDGVAVECILNPGAFPFQGKTWLLLRVAERPRQKEQTISTVVLDPATPAGMRILELCKDDPDLVYDEQDPRGFVYQGKNYLTTLSHLRLASSSDGVHFEVADTPTLMGEGDLEAFGIEDCRVTEIEGCFYLTYTAVSVSGFGVGLISTTNWKDFTRHGMIIPPSNKDCTFFPERINGRYYALHRPTLHGSTNHIWLSSSPDLEHWGAHRCIVQTRPGMWDSVRIGAGAAPIRTPQGWLEIYHGANEQNRYCLGALLFDLDDPTSVIARSHDPIMEPQTEYETNGFFGSVIFTNGTITDGDTLTVYYGASDLVVCGATFSLQAILDTLV